MENFGHSDETATDHLAQAAPVQDTEMADAEQVSVNSNANGNLNDDKGDDYVYFNRSTVGFSDDVIPKAKAFQLKLEHFYKSAVEAAVQRNSRYVLLVLV